MVTLSEVEGMTLKSVRVSLGFRVLRSHNIMLDIGHSIGHRRNGRLTPAGIPKSDSPDCVIASAVAV